MRTVDEIVHETAAAMMPEIGTRCVAAIIVCEATSKGGDAAARTAWRFINCLDPKIQAQALREIADLIEQTAQQPEG